MFLFDSIQTIRFNDWNPFGQGLALQHLFSFNQSFSIQRHVPWKKPTTGQHLKRTFWDCSEATHTYGEPHALHSSGLNQLGFYVHWRTSSQQQPLLRPLTTLFRKSLLLSRIIRKWATVMIIMDMGLHPKKEEINSLVLFVLISVHGISFHFILKIQNGIHSASSKEALLLEGKHMILSSLWIFHYELQVKNGKKYSGSK